MTRKILSAAQQVAESLRDELLRGRWTGALPGIHRLSADLGYSRKSVEQALVLLEKEGVLMPQGAGKRRQIAKLDSMSPRPMRIAILDYDPVGIKESVADLLNRLSDQGHTAFFVEKTLVELDMKVSRIAPLVRKTEADMWVVISAPTEVLKWFLAQPFPTFSIFGNFVVFPMAGIGIDYQPPLLQTTQSLLKLGHRRIVFLAGGGRLGFPAGPLWQSSLDEMEARGIVTGHYNIPKWNDSPEGFHQMLDSLFKHTPPTAMIIEEIPHLIATIQFCAARGYRIPQDISLICMCHGTSLDHCHPSIAHIRWDYRPVVRRITQWANNIALGKEDNRQSYIKAKIVDGGTVAKAPK